MKKLLLTCAALASLAAAAPASAQPYGGGRDGDFGNFGRREARAERQIEWCQRSGGLSWREARELRGELQQIEYLQRRIRYGGVNRYEYLQLERRLDRLERQIQRECRDGNDHRGGGDRWDGRGDRGDDGDRGGRGDGDGRGGWRGDR